MSFTVTPQPDHVPPRVRIDLDTEDSGESFTSLTIYRDGKPIREQPFIGSSETVAFDYEAPFGVPVTYSADGSVATYAQAYAESWSGLSGWTVQAGTPTVTSGFLTKSGSAQAIVSRALPPGVQRMVISSNPGFGGYLAIGRVTVAFNAQFANFSYYSPNESPGGMTWTSGAAVLTWDASAMTVETPQETIVIPRGSASGSFGSFLSVTLSTNKVPPFTLHTPSEGPFAATATTTLDVTEVWLIHPSQPALSCRIDAGTDFPGDLWIEAASGDSKGSEAQATIHRPIGRKKAVVITSGPRQADEWTLTVGAETIAAKNVVRAIVDDQTPLLLRSPASLILDLPDDWYSVGKVTTTRPETPSVDELTYTALPLIPVDEPIVRRGALWTCADVLMQYATARGVLNAFDTALDLAIGDRS